jgi:methyltransferase (TIGR00027 family)
MRNISTTAYLIAMYRALETERPDALFKDPFARELAGSEGAMAIEVLGKTQQGMNAVTIRTCEFDASIERLVHSAPVDTVLNLAAGLDTRPYRLYLPSDLRWIEVDLPEILEYKNQMLAAEQPACMLRRIPLDLTNAKQRRKLFADLGLRTEHTLVITEGLLMYLSEAQVGSLASDLHEQTAFRWWLSDLSAPYLRQKSRQDPQQQLFNQYFAEGKKTFLFAPVAGMNFFSPYGWQVKEFQSAWAALQRLKGRVRFLWFISLWMRWFDRPHWQAISQDSGFILLDRQDS